jgi:activator of HSP90 ATPase
LQNQIANFIGQVKFADFELGLILFSTIAHRMKGTKRSKISSSIRPVSSYFPTLSQHGNTIQNQSCGAEETYTNVDGTSSTTQQQSPAQQQDNPDTIVVNPEVHNNSTEYENGSVDLNPEDIVADPSLWKPIEELDVNVRDAARREYLVMGPCQLTSWS